MNTTAEGIDARGYLVGWMKAVTGMYAADIKHIPTGEWTKSQGGCSRPCNELTADALSLVIWTTDSIKGNTPGGHDEASMKALAAECADPKAATAKLAECMDNLVSAVAGASDETLNKAVTTPFGMTMPLFMIAQIAASHLWYHDGQLNYIQCLHGDGEVHWMEN